VADIVAIDGGTNSQMIHVRGIDDVLAAQRGIGTFQYRDDIRALDHGFDCHGSNVRASGQGERLWLTGPGDSKNLVQSLGCAGKQFSGALLAEHSAAPQTGENVVRNTGLVEPAHLSHLDLRDPPVPGITVPVFRQPDIYRAHGPVG